MYGLASVAQLDARPTGDQEVPGFDHEIFSAAILSLPVIQEGQFLAKECAQYWLTA